MVPIWSPKDAEFGCRALSRPALPVDGSASDGANVPIFLVGPRRFDQIATSAPYASRLSRTKTKRHRAANVSAHLLQLSAPSPPRYCWHIRLFWSRLFLPPLQEVLPRSRIRGVELGRRSGLPATDRAGCSVPYVRNRQAFDEPSTIAVGTPPIRGG